MDVDAMFAWMAIGAAASLAGMIWPFRRGTLGVVVNLLAGIFGAVLAGLASYLFLPSRIHGDTPTRLLYAALGALAGLGLVHAAWTHRVSDRTGVRGRALERSERPQ
jgi:uncharacterized membrane protein YeaQ/YmgE (transglycosylase-associated protein family)